MARTTADKVREILAPGKDYDIDNDPSLTPFIDSAANIVDDVSACAIKRGKTLSSAKLELIERWLAAHLYQQSDPAYKSKATESARGEFMGQSGLGLDNTRYGQTAKMFDTSGCLAALGKGVTAGAKWLGKTKTTRQTYADRN